MSLLDHIIVKLHYNASAQSAFPLVTLILAGSLIFDSFYIGFFLPKMLPLPGYNAWKSFKKGGKNLFYSKHELFSFFSIYREKKLLFTRKKPSRLKTLNLNGFFWVNKSFFLFFSALGGGGIFFEQTKDFFFFFFSTFSNK